MKQKVITIISLILMLAAIFSLAACHRAGKEETLTTRPVTVTETEVSKTTKPAAKTEAKTTAAKETTAKTTEKKTEKPTEQKTEKKTEKTTEATGSPVQRYSGKYGNGRCTIEVIGVANNTVEIHVYWSSSAFEHSEWTMTGNFDEAGKTVKYSDCVKQTITFTEDGSESTTVTEYKNGTGSFTFNGNSVTWNDNMEHIADGVTYTR